ncbi:dicarboxylate/amino acid:cation symporter [Luteimonas sp. RC10]|jgi:Na+/H+-dicarboxylate symporter|uniref:dicarboxylate/amino acid:cation symporter n=1 Tax=Luteimonas sp. RC10 TaxID=2587035 RepID=UPI00162001D0|nr:dicarboxylate/amino acid:cation symporter [Luteimonas sp. RC10]MBB3345125.1 DAACS family dicarboxylate/amino acid:cation (Na+ or H+) symporter [Luteimonas sp. RC10]
MSRPLASARARLPLHWKIAIGFAAGLLLGMLAHYTGLSAWAPTDPASAACAVAEPGWQCRPLVATFVAWVTEPLGTLFLSLIFMLIVPLLFSALVVGVSEMGDVASLGRIGWRTLAWTIVLSGLAVLLGLVMVNLFRPGAGVDPALAQQLLAESAQRTEAIVSDSRSGAKGMEMLLSIVPQNVVGAASDNANILALMFFALMFGIGLVLTKSEAAAALKRGIEGLFEVSMTLIGLVIRLAPIAVFCFMFNLAVLFGWDLLVRLGAYVAVVAGALALHMLVTYSLALRVFGGWSPLAFFRGAQEAMLMSFSTASSNATLPTALRVADENLKLPRKVSRFVLTIGATANQNGTALFEGVTVIFLAQFFGVDLSIGQQVLVMLVCILGGIGTAGVPSGSLPVVALICTMVGVPAEGIGLVLGVNHFLDMCRTTVNVTGDLGIAALVSRGEVDAPEPPKSA